MGFPSCFTLTSKSFLVPMRKTGGGKGEEKDALTSRASASQFLAFASVLLSVTSNTTAMTTAREGRRKKGGCNWESSLGSWSSHTGLFFSYETVFC